MLERLCALGLAACAMMAAGQAPAAAAKAQADAPRQFDAVSIKPSGPDEQGGFGFGPSGFNMKGQPLYKAVMRAYFPFLRGFGYAASPISGAPAWLSKDLYDVDAKYDEATAEALKTETRSRKEEIIRPMLQAMLAERCKLAVHMTMVDAPVYELVVSKSGAKLTETPADEKPPEHAFSVGDEAMMVPIYPKPAKEQLTFFRTSMADLALQLSTMVDRQVVDRTGLAGRYDFAVPRERRDLSASEADGTALAPGPTYTWNLSESGLELRPAKAPQPVLVIDHIEKPTEN